MTVRELVRLLAALPNAAEVRIVTGYDSDVHDGQAFSQPVIGISEQSQRGKFLEEPVEGDYTAIIYLIADDGADDSIVSLDVFKTAYR